MRLRENAESEKTLKPEAALNRVKEDQGKPSKGARSDKIFDVETLDVAVCGENAEIAVLQRARIQNDPPARFAQILNMRVSVTYDVPVPRMKRVFGDRVTAVVAVDEEKTFSVPVEANGLTLNDRADLRGFLRERRFVVVIAENERRFEVGKVADEPRLNDVAAMDDLIDAMSFKDVQGYLN